MPCYRCLANRDYSDPVSYICTLSGSSIEVLHSLSGYSFRLGESHMVVTFHDLANHSWYSQDTTGSKLQPRVSFYHDDMRDNDNATFKMSVSAFDYS